MCAELPRNFCIVSPPCYTRICELLKPLKTKMPHPGGRPPKLFEETQEGKRQAKRIEKEQMRERKLALKVAEKEERLRKAEQKKAQKEEEKELRRELKSKGLVTTSQV